MAAYYYFVSTLSTLFFDGTHAVSHAEFLETASRFVSKQDMELLEIAELMAPPLDDKKAKRAQASLVLNSYFSWERALRNELVRLRANRLKKQAELFYRPSLPEWNGQKTAQLVFAQENPLEAELLLERERWNYISMLEVNQFFNTEYLIAYCLKLQILERLKQFKKELGEANFTSLYNEVFHSARETTVLEK